MTTTTTNEQGEWQRVGRGNGIFTQQSNDWAWVDEFVVLPAQHQQHRQHQQHAYNP